MADSNKRKVFIVDDEPIQNELLKDFLSERFDFSIRTFLDGESAIKELSQQPDIIILDYHLNGNNKAAMNGVEVLKIIKESSPTTEVVMLSGQDKLEVAIDSMKFGAYDYVVKGETAFKKVENTLSKILEMGRMSLLNNTQKRIITYLIVVLVLIVCMSIYLYFFTDAYSH